MTKLRLQILVPVLLLLSFNSVAQNNYLLQISSIDKDSIFIISNLGIRTVFATRNDCASYINQLTANLQTKGYVTASIDSILYDSAFARVVMYVGDKYEWAQIGYQTN
jgi:hypothetical protein